MDLNYVEKVPGRVKVERALVSLADKSGLEELAEGLVRINPDMEFLSTGGTYRRLEEILGGRGRLTRVSDYTGQPEMQGGLVKTLDFKIYLGLLSEAVNPDHQKDLERTGAKPLDLVAVNLYPFEKTIAAGGATLENARGNIDIGGPCMLRAAAKNFHRVSVLCSPTDYPHFLEEMEKSGGETTLEQRFALARKGFRHTAAYDAAIAEYLGRADKEELNRVYRREE